MDVLTTSAGRTVGEELPIRIVDCCPYYYNKSNLLMLMDKFASYRTRKEAKKLPILLIEAPVEEGWLLQAREQACILKGGRREGKPPTCLPL